MSHNKSISLLVALTAITLVFMITITLNRGVPLESVIAGIFLSIVYFLIFAAYLSRFALILLGVFAVYKILKERSKASNTTG
jgi:Golgi nucleoside diphosphatase